MCVCVYVCAPCDSVSLFDSGVKGEWKGQERTQKKCCVSGRPKAEKRTDKRTPPGLQRFHKRRRNEALLETFQGYIEQLKPKPGHAYTKAGKRMLLLILLSTFVTHLVSDPQVDPTHSNKAFQEAADVVHCSLSHMREEWKSFEAAGRIVSPKKRGRKRLGPEICYDGENLTTEHIAHIQADIQKFNKETGEGVTLKKLRKSLKQAYGVKVRNALLRKILLRLGYKWLRATKKGRIKKCASRKLRIQQFLTEYAAALKLQNVDKTHVIIYMDESYVHQRHSSNYTWAAPADNTVYSGSGKGVRLIIVHAVSKDGLLYSEGHQRQNGMCRLCWVCVLCVCGVRVCLCVFLCVCVCVV